MIAGAGPAGLMLAAELALAGVEVAVVERNAGAEVVRSRAGGLHARTIEVLDQRGVADRFLAEGKVAQITSFGVARLDISDFPTRHNYGLALPQNRFERVLGGWVEELGVRIQRGVEVNGFTSEADGVDVELSDGRTLHAGFLVGCDGGRSTVRRLAGIDFPGTDPSITSFIADVDLSEEPPFGIRRNEVGQHALAKLEDGRVGVVVTERYAGEAGVPRLEDVRRALVAVWGTDFGARNATSISRFTDTTRQAASYRSGRVLIAGDAAHVHYPIGGQGLNLGVQDAVNLGWKLAQVAKGISPDALLDTYQAERQPVTARVLRATMAMTALTPSTPRNDALRDAVAEMLSMDEPRRRFGGMMSGLDIHYDHGDGHPLVGRRMADLDLITASGTMRVFELLHEARPVLIDFGNHGVSSAAGVRVVHARYEGAWELPVLGAIPAPSAVLVRPDGYVAWAGDGTEAGLADALARWFGAA
ncbi:MAG TPA: FAD-dependent monooxygenase [Candidatus Dormibacteraeota bacterium]|nr:FAD-dependent monooxygenase [Candidatus Dormibacteraeota bacterium]